MGSALLAVLGALIIRYNPLSSQFLLGFPDPGANLCFALGQVGYKRLMEVMPLPQYRAFSGFIWGR